MSMRAVRYMFRHGRVQDAEVRVAAWPVEIQVLIHECRGPSRTATLVRTGDWFGSARVYREAEVVT